MVALYQILPLIQTLLRCISSTISAIDSPRHASPEIYPASPYYVVVFLIATQSFFDQHVALSVSPLDNSRHDFRNLFVMWKRKELKKWFKKYVPFIYLINHLIINLTRFKSKNCKTHLKINDLNWINLIKNITPTPVINIIKKVKIESW